MFWSGILLSGSGSGTASTSGGGFYSTTVNADSLVFYIVKFPTTIPVITSAYDNFGTNFTILPPGSNGSKIYLIYGIQKVTGQPTPTFQFSTSTDYKWAYLVGFSGGVNSGMLIQDKVATNTGGLSIGLTVPISPSKNNTLIVAAYTVPSNVMWTAFEGFTKVFDNIDFQIMYKLVGTTSATCSVNISQLSAYAGVAVSLFPAELTITL